MYIQLPSLSGIDTAAGAKKYVVTPLMPSFGLSSSGTLIMYFSNASAASENRTADMAIAVFFMFIPVFLSPSFGVSDAISGVIYL